ncbi:MAG: hypothetical protein ACRCSK_08780 [Fusobacteriaceae bacterium]
MNGKSKFIFTIIIVATLLALNNIELNRVSQKEKELNSKLKELDEVTKNYDNIIMEYDSKIDLKEIRKELEAKGLKVTREVEYLVLPNADENSK